jgi:hypothetical protein
MEYWSIGVLGIETQYSTTPILHHSINPTLQLVFL